MFSNRDAESCGYITIPECSPVVLVISRTFDILLCKLVQDLQAQCFALTCTFTESFHLRIRTLDEKTLVRETTQAWRQTVKWNLLYSAVRKLWVVFGCCVCVQLHEITSLIDVKASKFFQFCEKFSLIPAILKHNSLGFTSSPQVLCWIHARPSQFRQAIPINTEDITSWNFHVET